jgi:hypothetical protein
MIEFLFLSIIFACGVFAGFIAGTIFNKWRDGPLPIPEWEESYFHDERPRAVTRIQSKDIDWEVRQ